MKKFPIITIILGTLLIIIGIVAPLVSVFLMPPSTPSIGIIGGADGPTAIFVTSTLWINSVYGRLTILGLIELIVGVVLLIISRFKKK